MRSLSIIASLALSGSIMVFASEPLPLSIAEEINSSANVSSVPHRHDVQNATHTNTNTGIRNGGMSVPDGGYSSNKNTVHAEVKNRKHIEGTPSSTVVDLNNMGNPNNMGGSGQSHVPPPMSFSGNDNSKNDPHSLPSTYKEKRYDNKKGLNDKEIDQIFLSFIREREIEKRKKLEEMARKKREEQEAKEAELKERLSNQNPYYGMTGEEAEKERENLMNGGNVAPLSPEELKKQAEEAEKAALEQAKYAAMQVELEIYGTSCYKKKCIAFSSLGVIKKGKKIEDTGEDVLVVTPTYIKTNLRKIKF